MGPTSRETQTAAEFLVRYEHLIGALVASVARSQEQLTPFFHLEFTGFFPEEIYLAMLDLMPRTTDFRRMSGGAGVRAVNPDGEPTRLKIDLFPDQITHLPVEKRKLWDLVGAALRSDELQSALVRRLAKEISNRFGKIPTRFFANPSLTRDFPGYSLEPHPDASTKAITVQLYLPRDSSAAHIGTVFYETLPGERRTRSKVIQFVPNSGYAFAVAAKTWHSVDEVDQSIEFRNSILLTYYVDSGLRYSLNRLTRLGNWLKQSSHIS